MVNYFICEREMQFQELTDKMIAQENALDEKWNGCPPVIIKAGLSRPPTD